MRTLSTTSRFRKDVRLQKRRGKDLEKFGSVLKKLQKDGVLGEKYQAHRLSGEWNGLWECHIEPDWLLIHDVTPKEVLLVRTGTHTDLFKM